MRTGEEVMNEPMVKNAVLSPCGVYRYRLSRSWDSWLGTLVFVMLNPSTADADKDDPTIRKCIGFAKRHGYGGIVVVNLFALRSTDPRALVVEAADGVDVVGPLNDDHIYHECRERTVVLAWGCYGLLGMTKDRAREVLELLGTINARALCLKLNGDTSPAHPLMLSYENQLQPFTGKL